MNYRHLTLEQRYQIAALQRAGLKLRQIAQVVERHPSTIGRELRRNTPGRVYVGSIAHGQAKRRRQRASSRPRLTAWLRAALWHGLHTRHSPEQIRGRLALLNLGSVSAPTIYRYARRWGPTPVVASSAPLPTDSQCLPTVDRSPLDPYARPCGGSA